MPIWEDDGIPTPSQAPSIIQRVRAGNALPILSHNAMFDLALFGFEAFKRYYAKCINYPHPELPDIGQLAHLTATPTRTATSTARSST